MIPNLEPSPIRRLGKWNSLFVLSLVCRRAVPPNGGGTSSECCTKPEPDVIVFTNGDQLTGTLERATGDSFVFKSDVVGEVTVSADKIKELHANGKFVALKEGREDHSHFQAARHDRLTGTTPLTMAATPIECP